MKATLKICTPKLFSKKGLWTLDKSNSNRSAGSVDNAAYSTFNIQMRLGIPMLYNIDEGDKPDVNPNTSACVLTGTTQQTNPNAAKELFHLSGQNCDPAEPIYLQHTTTEDDPNSLGKKFSKIPMHKPLANYVCFGNQSEKSCARQ